MNAAAIRRRAAGDNDDDIDNEEHPLVDIEGNPTNSINATSSSSSSSSRVPTSVSLMSRVSSRLCTARGILALLTLSVIFGYAYFKAEKAGYLDPDVRGKIMVVYPQEDWKLLGFDITLQQGFFSDFFSVVGALYYAELHGAAGVRVWYPNTNYVVSCDDHKPPCGPSYWEYFFEPNMRLLPKRAGVHEKEVHFNRYGRFGHFGSFSPMLVGFYSAKYAAPFPIQTAVPLEKIGSIVDKHIKVKPAIWKKVNDHWDANVGPNDWVVGVHYRGTDKKKKAYPYSSPPYRLFSYYVQLAEKRYKPAGMKLKLFVATDEIEYIEWINEKYGDIAFSWTDTPRASSLDPVAAEMGAHKMNFDPYRKGESALVDCLLLSKTRYIVKNRSSLSDSSLFFDNKNFTFILGVNDPVHSSDNMPQPPMSVILDPSNDDDATV